MENIKNLGKIKATLLADFILQKYGCMSHLKLQKLVYYCDAYHLAYFDEELINENFEAWVHGPVCRDIYNDLKDKSILYSDINKTFDKSTYNPENIVEQALTTDQKDILKNVLDELSTWTGLDLENATHREFPWIEARVGFSPGEKCDVFIKKESMKQFYKAELNG
ncbi:putative phage-associated protein [Chryseobacterium sp. 7]|uniref:Panacea domain-containing protein n=1 Tax=Chryseobacterium sp. 7 TaxID=2035214 RepID=UPI000EAFDBD2|nr:type II toxin-antitoxin system antitoxin SocA domain-containing protein [Chryseobacterium sp. 7]RLJ33869.1 putative phage-associated protein [Chryseobacterium sp. 7]